jgi:hypothetical protein
VYWLLVLSLAGVLFFKGAAPPPSRKFMEIGVPSMLVLNKLPLKYYRGEESGERRALEDNRITLGHA